MAKPGAGSGNGAASGNGAGEDGAAEAGVDVGPLLGRCRFPEPGSRVELAVSGGADSLALLVLASAAGCRPVAHHVDHGLRRGSSAEADVVEAAASRLGAEVVRHVVEVAPGPNLEARARTARLAALPLGVATGHTADDQVETILINLLRGAGLAGLAGMVPGPRHPILALRRSETRAVCAASGMCPVEDPSNLDPAHLRNRVRHELVPALCELAERDVVAVVARQADLLRKEDAFLERLAEAIDAGDARSLAHSDPVLARRAVRGWLRRFDTEGHPPDAAAVERVLAVARNEIRACDAGGGLRVSRSAGRLAVDATGRGEK
ncbi:MAG: tRNA lysidine(34) synthetase TilS [Acidimicrobiales bacterium]